MLDEEVKFVETGNLWKSLLPRKYKVEKSAVELIRIELILTSAAELRAGRYCFQGIPPMRYITGESRQVT